MTPADVQANQQRRMADMVAILQRHAALIARFEIGTVELHFNGASVKGKITGQLSTPSGSIKTQ